MAIPTPQPSNRPATTSRKGIGGLFILDPSYTTPKILRVISGEVGTGILSIPHNLGYTPFVVGFMKGTLSSSAGSTGEWQGTHQDFDVWADNTNIHVYGQMATMYPFKVFLCIDKQT